MNEQIHITRSHSEHTKAVLDDGFFKYKVEDGANQSRVAPNGGGTHQYDKFVGV